MDFPELRARTRGFTLGVPGRFAVSGDGRQVLFTRSRAGDDPIACLWAYDVGTQRERLLLDPAALAVDESALPAAELRRRERLRQVGGGVTAFATDATQSVVALALGGQLVVVEPAAGTARVLPTAGGVVDPRPDPSGRLVGYLSGGALHVIGIDGAGARTLAEPDGPAVTYGLAEHVAAESMHRTRGWWWAPEGRRVAVARVDESQVEIWHIANLADPLAEPVALRYPGAGTTNADVSLHVIDLDGGRVEIDWDRRAHEYLAEVVWDRTGLTIAVQNRAQTGVRVLRADPETGVTAVEHEQHDPAWVNLMPGTPARTSTGALIWTEDHEDTRHLLVGGERVTPPGLQVQAVLAVDGDAVLFAAATEPTQRHVWLWTADAGPRCLTDAAGVHDGQRAGGTTVLASRSATEPGTRVTVQPGGPIVSHALTAPVTPAFDLFAAGELGLRTAVLLPTGHRPGDRLPVLLDPYGGPGAQKVVAAQHAYLTSQWFADQGFAVVVVDGRGTPGRGPRWEKTVHGDFGAAAVEDQIIGLRAAADRHPDLDLDRVGIRGWSYGGYLAARAVLRRPDVFHAAVAGAPVTDQRLYDTHWQERFLGHPDEHAARYDADSLLADAPALRRPLLLVHGLLDDNVHPAHTLLLSTALLAAGRPHQVLTLPTSSHMLNGADAALVLHAEHEFLRDALRPEVRASVS
ncbi:S9 family peptidase [Asanoa iriomotensis]|uniref:Peptidase n=1 Tax=Asanoa iriomotensis TaxID=234613 RepID=A0ABQ4BUW3_9ACTN|nr:prolyl oligopeptidase family serine peptidase [Asanoa iriomotensis]GIF54323.1 peptidase [Asanoa iriomotensis]